MKHLMEKLEQLLELGGIKKDVTFLVISGIAVICSLLKWNPLPFAAGEVAFIMQLGGLLEELTVARARAGIEKLVHLTPQTARVLRDGKEEILPAERVRVEDRIRVLPGESIPVAGAKNTLRAVECCSPAKGGARRETQRKFTCPPARPEGK